MPKFQEVEIDHNYLDSLLITDIVLNKTWPIVALNEVFRWLFRKDTERLTKRKIRGKKYFTGKTKRKFLSGFTGKESFPPFLLIEYRGILMTRESRNESLKESAEYFFIYITDRQYQLSLVVD